MRVMGLLLPSVVTMLPLKSTETDTDAPSFMATVRQMPLSSFLSAPTSTEITRVDDAFARLVLGEAVGALERAPAAERAVVCFRRGFGESNGRYCHHGDGERRQKFDH